ncbi:MAG TPA: 2-dehydro-3-deoxygluconokinase [Firmicutes bacterium]|jgi:2-dehydro-3-deoxygluconokinase|nr:2-dehydro-3-deoxygluconokinase [Bacillota bacterium]
MAPKVVTFGEIMLRLSPPGYHRFSQAASFDAVYGGGEANVAASLANYGCEAYFVTKVPPHEVGQCAINSLRALGIHTEHIHRGGDRLGIYFCEAGASQRPSKVVYDRANSSISQVEPGEFDWEDILSGAEWFHFTGITPALGDGPAAVTMEAVKVAKKLGVKVSADLNYRKKLWTPEKANAVMSGLMEYVDVVVGNEEDAEKVFGVKAEGSDIVSGQISREGYREVARELVRRFGFEKVAITLRESISASDNNWSGMLYDGERFYESRRYAVHIVDRVGGGDSFAGGLIYALLENADGQWAVEFAAAASCLKHSIYGDFNLVNASDVHALAAGDASGRVQR